MIGMILGNRYELLEKIGEGGMAHVYKAKCNKLNRFVAVKILKEEFADNKDISEKFKREATSIANLSDTNIVNVLDVGTQDGINYIVMEYVSGKTLKELINFNGTLAYNVAIKIAIQIAKALECAHKNNIIHRDVKPQNILVTEDGDVKVTDFGIAKSTDSSTITNTTSILGSAHYLSPEQAKGGYIDSRADIYSFGIVLYEMVTGKLPFEGDSPVTIALKHLQETAVSPKSINSSVPESLNRLILKCMEKDSIKRYQSFKDIIHDLQKIQQNPDVIIGQSIQDDTQHTIIMSPVGVCDTRVVSDKKIEPEYDSNDEDYDEDDYEETPKKKKNKRNKKKSTSKIVKIIVGLVGLIILASAGYYFAIVNKDNKTVAIPNIMDKNVKEADEELNKVGLILEEVGTKKSDKPEGTILEVDPKVGTEVKKNTKVKVIVSEGKEKLLMPDFRDFEVASIKQYLESQGFTNYTITEKYSEDVQKGGFISQNPEPKTEVNKDTKIEIVVSKGPQVKLAQVPSVVGTTVDAGKSALENLGLKVAVEYKNTDKKDEDNKILSQSVTNSRVEQGTTITIVVGKYEAKEITITSLQGKTVSEAKAILQSLGINNISINGPSGDDDIVVSSTEKVKEGGTVTLTTKKKENPKPDQNGNTDGGGNSGGNPKPDEHHQQDGRNLEKDKGANR